MTYSKPPLPFQGNKSRWASALPQLFKQIDADVIIDAYGGSGLLSHIAKLASPRSKVYFNDYDNYSARLAKIDQTNALKAQIYALIKDYPIDKKLPQVVKQAILDLLPCDADFLTISAWICFSGNYAKDKSELSKLSFWRALNNSPKPYAKPYDYLQDVTITRQDALELIRSLQAEHAGRRILLVLDPPYIQTLKEGYKSGISLVHNLELIKLIRPPFLYFSSTSSEAGALLEYSGQACFKMQRDLAIKTTPNKNRNDKDLLFYNLATLELVKLIRPPFLYFSSTSSESGELLKYSGIEYHQMQRTLSIKTARGANRNDRDLLFYNLATGGGRKALLVLFWALNLELIARTLRDTCCGCVLTYTLLCTRPYVRTLILKS